MRKTEQGKGNDLLVDVEGAFHGVGQGLFSTHKLSVHEQTFYAHAPDGRSYETLPRAVLNFTYDCGAHPRTTALNHAIDEYSKSLPSSTMDLLAISHFDADHINGLERLLSKSRRIGTLLLPYDDLASRAASAIVSQDISERPAIRFAIDPIGYLRSRELLRKIDSIILVSRASDGEGPVPKPPSPEPAPEPPSPIEQPQREQGDVREQKDDSPAVFAFEEEEVPDEMLDDLGFSGGSPDVRVRLLKARHSISWDSLWEFVPYNEPRARELPEDFYGAVFSLKKDLLGASDPKKIAAALKALKEKYRYYFGSDSESQNALSLFLYSGPIRKNVVNPHFDHHVYSDRSRHRGSIQELRRIHLAVPEFSSILLTGDGYLDSETRFVNLLTFLGRERMEDIAVLQVMHHGSRKNWMPGLAARLSPILSVFSSDPELKKFGHPHAEVLRDFWRYGPFQASKGMPLHYDFRVLL